MSRIKPFSALLLVLCVFLSLLTSCDKTAADETTADNTSDTFTEITTAPETTARELHEPNVRQLCGNFGSYHNFTKDSNYPVYTINSNEQLEHFIDCYLSFSQNDALPAWSGFSYGFSLSGSRLDGALEDGAFYKNDVMSLYNEDFFKERVLVVLWGYFHDTTCQRLLTVINETNGDVMIFMISIGSKNSSPSLMDSYEVIKFIELDRLYLEGKTVLSAEGEGAKALRIEWRIINEAAQPETDEESEVLLRETYGDTFYYIEPWRFSSLYGG